MAFIPHPPTAALDLQRFASTPSVHGTLVAATAQAAINSKGYLKPGDWLKQLSDVDLMFLMMCVENLTDDPRDIALRTVVAIALILAQAEGLDSISAEQPHAYVNQLAHFLAIESLKRKGLVDVNYDNISFGDDANELPIARIKDGVSSSLFSPKDQPKE